jgi:uncharacterized protein YbaP (TraB family)
MDGHPARRHQVTLLLLALLAIPRFGSAQAGVAGQKNFLWTVDGGARTLYLAGSLHALNREVYPLPAAFDRAFAASDTLVEEIDLTEMDLATAGPELIAKGLAREGRTLDRAVSPETFARLEAYLRRVGLPAEMVKPFKPWMAVVMISALEAQRAGLDAALGLDKHFFDRAKASGKPVIGLETAASQLGRLDGLPDAAQEHLLRTTLEELELSTGEMAELVSAWKRGDRPAIEKMTMSGLAGHPEAYSALIVERNSSWMPQLEACLARRACFVVVGAAHLVGPDGLLAMLEKKGYRVSQQ